MSFRIGEEIVCIDDELHLEEQNGAQGGLDGLKKGQLYHVRWCGECEAHTPGKMYVRLVEIFRDPAACRDNSGAYYEPPFFSWRFKRPKKLKTDISIFQQMLNPTDAVKKKHQKYIDEVKELEKVKEDAVYCPQRTPIL